MKKLKQHFEVKHKVPCTWLFENCNLYSKPRCIIDNMYQEPSVQQINKDFFLCHGHFQDDSILFYF